jgi:hypothetical protein
MVFRGLPRACWVLFVSKKDPSSPSTRDLRRRHPAKSAEQPEVDWEGCCATVTNVAEIMWRWLPRACRLRAFHARGGRPVSSFPPNSQSNGVRCLHVRCAKRQQDLPGVRAMAAVLAGLKSVDFYRKLKRDLQQVLPRSLLCERHERGREGERCEIRFDVWNVYHLRTPAPALRMDH